MTGQVSEAEFQAAVVQLAKTLGWHWHHAHDSRRTEAGFPDLVLVRQGELLFVELKTDRGRLSRAQAEWRDVLQSCGAAWHLWRPSDWDDIARTLAGSSGRQNG